MPVIFQDFGRVFDDSEIISFEDFNGAADDFVYTVASKLSEVGWEVTPHFPRFILRMPIDMDPFLITGGTDQALFWVIQPVDPLKTPLLIVDDLRGFTNPEGWGVKVTGTLDADVVLAAVAEGLGEVGTLPGFAIGVVARFNVGTPDRYYVMEITYPVAGDPPFIFQMIKHSGPGVAHNATAGELCGDGGYSCTSLKNGDSPFCSFFIGRTTDVDGNNHKGPVYYLFARDAESLPDADVTKPSEQSPAIRMDTVFSDYTIAASEFSFFLKETSPGHTGHIEMCSVTKLKDTSGAFLVGTSSTFFADSFREGPHCNGIMLLQKNGDHIYTGSFGIFTPRVMTLWSLDSLGTQWENGLGPILEPRIAFAIKEDKVAGVVGSIPYCIIVHKTFPPGSIAFIFDEKIYKPYTQNAISNNGSGLGTLCFASNETVTPSDCVVI